MLIKTIVLFSSRMFWFMQTALTEELSFGLINSHHVLDGIKPAFQNTADVGGLHLR